MNSADRARNAAKVRKYRAKHPAKAREAARVYYHRHAEKCREKARRWRSDPENLPKMRETHRRYLAVPENHAKIRRAAIKRHLRKEYGITIDQLEALYERQGGRCAVCGVNASMRGRDCIQVDHDHKTGRVRGLLCGKCNRALGDVSDNIGILRDMITYLLACGVRGLR